MELIPAVGSHSNLKRLLSFTAQSAKLCSYICGEKTGWALPLFQVSFSSFSHLNITKLKKKPFFWQWLFFLQFWAWLFLNIKTEMWKLFSNHQTELLVINSWKITGGFSILARNWVGPKDQRISDSLINISRNLCCVIYSLMIILKDPKTFFNLFPAKHETSNVLL